MRKRLKILDKIEIPVRYNYVDPTVVGRNIRIDNLALSFMSFVEP